MEDTPRRILVVDDEVLVGRALARALQHPRITVKVVDHPHDALQALDTSTFDLVLSDFDMPGLDGVSLLGVIRDRHPTVRRVLTSAAPPENIDALVDSGEIEQFFAKPYHGDFALRLGKLLNTPGPVPQG